MQSLSFGLFLRDRYGVSKATDWNEEDVRDLTAAVFSHADQYVEPDSLILLDKELYTKGLRRVSRQGDLVVKARVRGEPSYILIHLEQESGSRTHFPRRMFGYFARYHENEQWIPIYPVVIYTFAQPKLRAETITPSA